jgi:curved DNA binding protein
MELTEPLGQLNDDNNLEKYKVAGKIVAHVLDKLVDMAKPDASVYEMCVFGDRMIKEEVDKVYKSVKYKGIAFPTSVSINDVAGHYSPLKEIGLKIKEGDLVKIELGTHIDGFPALVVFTVVVNTGDEQIDDKRANVIKAVSEASKEVLKVMKPDKTNMDVVKILEKYANKYDCSLPVTSEENFERGIVPGIVSSQMSQDIIDGYNDESEPGCEYVHRLILNRHSENYDFSMVKLELEEDEVYGIDIVMSTGSGKLSRMARDNSETAIYKRNCDRYAELRLRSSKEALGKFGKSRFPQNIRYNYNVRTKLGAKECCEKGVLTPYLPTTEKYGEFVARAKFTVVVRDKPVLVTGRSMSSELQKVK